jgi:N-acetylmuramoyl-L-alanine amidase
LSSVRGTAAFTITTLVFVLALLALDRVGGLQAQGAPPPTPLTLVSRDGRRPVPTTILSGQELIALDDVAALFQVAVREDALAGGVTVTYRGRSIVASADQPMASVDGRLVPLPSAIIRSGTRWLVPIDFLSRALGPIYDRRIELRRPSRLLIVGDVRVPRVTARFDSVGPPTRATIEVTPAVPVTVTTEAGRVILRIEADALDLALPGAGNGLIEQIRAGDQPNTVTVALTPAAGAARVSSASADTLARVIIEVPSATAAAEPAPAPPGAATPPAAPPSDPALALTRGFQTVVIDPGHGGDDIGVRGAGGTEEKHVTLDIARRLRERLETRLGLRVVLTREDDRAVPPDERASTANNSKADLFLSLHVNAALSAKMSGAEVFHLQLDSEGEEARRDATSEAIRLPTLSGASREVDIVRWDLAQAAHVEDSAILAGFLEAELRRAVPMSPRPIQPAAMRVLTGANMPAALVEMAFLTNPEDEARARGDEFRNGIAQALFEAIVRFRAYAEEQGNR